MKDARLTHIANRQYGVFSRAQALGAGMSAGAISRRVRNGDWIRVLPGVYRFALVVVTEKWRQLAMAGLLWAGDAALSHRTAGAVWGLPDMDTRFIEIVVPRKVRSPAPWLRVHFGDLSPQDCAREGRFALTSVPRTLMDLAAVLDADTLESTLDSALMSGRTSIRHLSWRLKDVRGNGRGGIATLRRLIEERSGERGLPTTELEALFQRLARRNLPLPVPQFVIEDHGRFVARADFAYPDRKIAIECDSVQFHAGPQKWQHDLDRQNRLLALGWMVLRITWRRLRDDPEGVVETIRSVLEQAAQVQ